MANHYDKISDALKRIRKIQDLIAQGYGRPSEKDEAIALAKETAKLFTDDIFQRRAEKLSAVTVWSLPQRSGNPFISTSEAKYFDDWIKLFDEYLEKRRVHSDFSSEHVHIHSIIDGEDQHLIITEKGSSEHAHLIIDGGTGEIRIDPKDVAPHKLIKAIRAEVELKSGETVHIAGSSISFTEAKTE